MSHPQPSPRASRRSFLGTTAATLAALGGWLAPRRAGALALPDEEAIATGEFSDAWLGRLTGRHKQYVDAVSANEGWPLVFANNFRNTFNQAAGVPDAQLSSVVGLRHHAMPLALSDAMWEKYRIGELLGLNDPQTKAPATRNFFHRSKPGDIFDPSASIDRLVARGTIFPVCNVALTVASGLAAAKVGVKAEDAKQEWIASLLPGTVLVPSGVYALTRAQERGCAYCFGG